MYNLTMDLLNFINTYIIKYILIILGLILLIYIFKLLIEFKHTSKHTNNISRKISSIKQSLEDIEIDKEKIEYTKTNSLPLFIDVFLVSIIVRAAYKDYKKTKVSRRSMAKSTIKEYLRYHDILKFKSPRLIKNVIKTILKVV